MLQARTQFPAALHVTVPFVGAVQTDSFKKSLALESSMAWLVVIAAVVVVLSAMLLPRYARNSTVIEHI